MHPACNLTYPRLQPHAPQARRGWSEILARGGPATVMITSEWFGKLPPPKAAPLTAAACATYGCSRRHLRLQPPPPTVAASVHSQLAAAATYGCSLRHLRLQPPPPTVAGWECTLFLASGLCVGGGACAVVDAIPICTTVFVLQFLLVFGWGHAHIHILYACMYVCVCIHAYMFLPVLGWGQAHICTCTCTIAPPCLDRAGRV